MLTEIDSFSPRLKGLDAQGRFGMFAPAGTPQAIQDKMSADLRQILAQPDIQAKLLESDIVAGRSTPAEFTRQVRSDYEMHGEIIRKHRSR